MKPAFLQSLGVLALVATLWGCVLLPPTTAIYVPVRAAPDWQSVRTIVPSLPTGRWAIVDRFARWSHKGAIKLALIEGEPVPVSPAHQRPSPRSRTGQIDLVDGRQLLYWIDHLASGTELVVLQFPDRTLVALELPVEEEEDDEDDC